MRCTTVPPENNIKSTWLLNNTCVVHYMFLRCICNWLKMTAEGEVQIGEWLKATCEYHTLTRWAAYWHPLVLKAKFVYTTFSKYKFQRNIKYKHGYLTFDKGNNMIHFLVSFQFNNTSLHRKQTPSILQKTMRNFLFIKLLIMSTFFPIVSPSEFLYQKMLFPAYTTNLLLCVAKVE